VIERAGIPTVSITIVRQYTEKVKPPRSVFLRWPFGHPLGEPFRADQHRAVLAEVFRALYTIKTPGEIIDAGFRWRRQGYDHYNIEEVKRILDLRP
jgi:hypothetical protein